MPKLLFLAACAATLAGCAPSWRDGAAAEMPGFDPVKGTVATNGFSVSVWGREYRWKNSVFPVSVKTAGREIFAAPMALHAEFATTNHESRTTRHDFHDWTYTRVKQNDDLVQVVASAHCEDVMVNAAVTVERDGFVKTDVKIVPYGYYSLHKVRDQVPTLAKLWFEATFTKESSGLFHYWSNSTNSVCVSSEVNSGETKTRDFPFKAWTWCGWEDGGFGVACESAEAFELDDPAKCISVVKEADKTRLVYRLLDHAPAAWKGKRDRWGDALMPVCWTFGLQATPVKPRPLGDPDVYRRIHIYELPQAHVLENKIPEKFGKAGVRYVVFHSTYSRAEGCALIADPAEFREIVDRFHANGVKVLIYYGFEYPSILPSWNEKHEAYLIRGAHGRNVGGWQAETHRAYQSCWKSGWADDVLANVCETLDRYRLDGIYTDGTYVPWECANERHGCGWRDAAGHLHTTFPILAVRDFGKRLYRAVHARGGTIDTHQSACMVTPLLAFADSCFDGENVQGALAKNPDYLPTDAFRCEYSGYAFGLPMTFIAYTNKRLTIEMLAAITLVHNVHPVPRELTDLDFVSKVWKIYEERALDAADFTPYWRRNVSDKKGVYCSVFRDAKRTTAVVANLARSAQTATLDLGATNATTVRDLLTGETFPVSGGKVAGDFTPFRPYLLAVE